MESESEMCLSFHSDKPNKTLCILCKSRRGLSNLSAYCQIPFLNNGLFQSQFHKYRVSEFIGFGVLLWSSGDEELSVEIFCFCFSVKTYVVHHLGEN